MRQLGTGAVIALCLTGALAPRLSAQRAEGAAPVPPPRLEIVRNMIDLGELPRGVTTTLVFEIRNAGGSTLRILEAKPG